MSIRNGSLRPVGRSEAFGYARTAAEDAGPRHRPEEASRARDPLSDTLGLGVGGRGSGRAYAAYPSLRQARWLLPAGSKEARVAGLREFFGSRNLKGRAFRAAVASGIFRGQKIGLEEEPLVRLESELAGLLGEEVQLAFYVGSPGAYRKSTALVLDGSGRSLAFARIATGGRTKIKVEAEHRNLYQLSGCAELRGRVPEVLGRFPWNDNEVLAITSGPPAPGPDRISEPHLEFCRALFDCSALEPAGVFAESAMYARLSEGLRRVEPALPEQARSSLHRALESVLQVLGAERVPLSMAHRDFAPWNTRIGPRGLFVFDWDFAVESAPPLYDVFHFGSIKSALFGGNELPEPRILESLLDATWPDGRRYLSHLYLAYLLDVSLFYGEARAADPHAGDDRVLRWFIGRLERFLDEGSPFSGRRAS